VGKIPIQPDPEVAHLFLDCGGARQIRIEAQVKGPIRFGELYRFDPFETSRHLPKPPAAVGAVLVLWDYDWKVQVKLHYLEFTHSLLIQSNKAVPISNWTAVV
jgi:hypothetical protein